MYDCTGGWSNLFLTVLSGCLYHVFLQFHGYFLKIIDWKNKALLQTVFLRTVQNTKMLTRKHLKVSAVSVYLITVNHPNKKHRKEAQYFFSLAAAELHFSRE